jgi:Protein of unknown function (DUF3108)
MWNKLAQIRQDPSYKRFGLALCGSALLHVWLVGGFSFKPPSFKKSLHMIEARLEMPKAATEKIELPQPVETITPKEPPIKKQAHIKKKSAEPLPEPTPSPIAETPVALAATEITPQVEPLPTDAPPQPVDAGLALNENAYQYVETEFEVRTAADGGAEGKVKITYRLNDKQQYQLTLLEANGDATLASPSLLQTSEGLLTQAGLQPVSYQYQLSADADKNSAASFDWQAKQVLLHTSNFNKTADLPDGAQDLLSFMYQFMYVPPAQNTQINITNGQEISSYDYKLEGEEITIIGLGAIKTVHLVHSGADSDAKTELWLAIDFQYIPVKIRKIATNGDLVELLASSIIVNRPTSSNLPPNLPLN